MMVLLNVNVDLNLYVRILPTLAFLMEFAIVVLALPAQACLTHVLWTCVNVVQILHALEQQAINVVWESVPVGALLNVMVPMKNV